MIQLNINGWRHRYDGDPSMPLLWFLRDVATLADADVKAAVDFMLSKVQ